MASDACCSAGKPVTHDYSPVGKQSKLGDLPIYESGSGPYGVIIIPDIFGFNYKQVFQVCDRLASYGFHVAAMDPFRGHAWTMDRFPPKPEDNFMEWIGKETSWEGKIHADVDAVLQHLRGAGATKLGCIGFCWGVSAALKAGQDGNTFSGVGGAHPALFGADQELAEKVQCPIILLPVHGDAPLDVFQSELGKRPYAAKCVFQRFDDQGHGFVAARGDWTKPEVAAAAGKAIDLIAGFLKSAMDVPAAGKGGL